MSNVQVRQGEARDQITVPIPVVNDFWDNISYRREEKQMIPILFSSVGAVVLEPFGVRWS